MRSNLHIVSRMCSLLARVYKNYWKRNNCCMSGQASIGLMSGGKHCASCFTYLGTLHEICFTFWYMSIYAKKQAMQIRSHAQKYFLKVQKSGTSEHVPPPRPKRKAAHPYPQKAPKKGRDNIRHLFCLLQDTGLKLIFACIVVSACNSCVPSWQHPISTSRSFAWTRIWYRAWFSSSAWKYN